MTTNHEELTCANCGCIIGYGDDFEHDGKIYCSDCFFEEFACCDHCGETVDVDDLVSVNNGEMYVCSDCADYHYTRCDHCGNYFTDRHIWAEDNYRAICNNCSDDYYVCSDCGDIVHYNDVVWHGDEPYCEYCAPEESEYIHDYSYKPHWNELRTDEDSDDCRLYGVELEIDDGDDAAECSEALNDINDHFIMKHDGSLNSEGIEIVTHPASLAFHRFELGWDEITQTAINHGYKSHDTTTCGLHVHIGREALQIDTPDKLVVLVDRLWNNLVTFSRREYRQLDDWAKKPNSEVTEADTPEIRKDKLDKVKSRGRYQAVNLRNDSTVEIRIFRGTLKTNTIIATLHIPTAL